MYCGSLFVWDGGRTMEGPPTFVAGNCVPGGSVVGDEADSSLLAALARRNDKDFWFLCAGVTGRRAIVTAERESKSPPCRKVRDKGGAPSSLDSNYLELSYATGLNLFAAGIV